MLEELGILNLADFEARARTVMPNAQFEMVDGGFNDEITFKRPNLLSTPSPYVLVTWWT